MPLFFYRFLRPQWGAQVPRGQIHERNTPVALEQHGRWDREVQGVYDDNCLLRRQAEELERRHLVDKERIQQQQRLLREVRDDASKSEKVHREEVNRLYEKLSSAQTRPDQLIDGQIIAEMRRLGQNLECWVKVNFKDNAQLSSSIHGAGGFPHTSAQRRALIQAHITELVRDAIFMQPYPGLPTDPWGELMEEMERDVQSLCRQEMAYNWRVATRIALEHITRASQENIFTQITQHVEDQFSMASSTDTDTRTRQLGDFLRKCYGLKIVLDRQYHLFSFQCSTYGTCFSSQSMTFAGSDGASPQKVRLSLWPGLLKSPFDQSVMVLEPELVWTMD